MDGWALVAAAGLMGLAGLPHCAAMCAAPCAAVAGRGPAGQPLFQAARLLGYGAAGAVAAAGVGMLREGLAFSPALRPLWTLLHLAALILAEEFKSNPCQSSGCVRGDEHAVRVFESLTTEELLTLSIDEMAERFNARRIVRYPGSGHWLPVVESRKVAMEAAAFFAA